MSEYYKSLISDEEVVAALIIESKRRQGTLPAESTRLKPNLNFLQRTVSNLVSSNTRIDKSQNSFKLEFQKDKNNLRKKCTSTRKATIDHSFEKVDFLKRKINFVKSTKDVTARRVCCIEKSSDSNCDSSNESSNIIYISSDEDESRMEENKNYKKRHKK